jgi:HEAT repeat protein
VPDVQALLADLISGEDARAESAASGLAQHGQPAVPLLLALLDSPKEDDRWWATRALAAQVGPEAALGLVRSLGDAAASVRQCAALGLRLRPSVEAMTALLQALSDPDRLVARLAADALATLGTQATPGVVAALASEKAAIRIEAARCLALIRDPDSIPALYNTLDDRSAIVQYWVEQALDRLGEGMVFFKP